MREHRRRWYYQNLCLSSGHGSFRYTDDGSGSVSILESYRALIAADFHPEHTIEFHWYSAEVNSICRQTERNDKINDLLRRVVFWVPKLSPRIMKGA